MVCPSCCSKRRNLPCKSKMSSSSTAATVGISWSELPDGPLAEIANRMDTKFDVLRLRAVCKSWRFSLSAHSFNIDDLDFPYNHDFPFICPTQVSPAAGNSTSASFLPDLFFRPRQTTIYRLTPAWDDSAIPWVIRVHESKPKTFSLMHPLTGSGIKPLPESDHLPRLIDLLRFRIMRITHLNHVESLGHTINMKDSIKKVVLTKDFFENGDRVLLVLTKRGKLGLWRFGDESWALIVADERKFNDIISHQGNFYATFDYGGGLVLIDSKLQPIQLVKDWMYVKGSQTHLVECGSKLFLVDQIGWETNFSFSLFKWDDKLRIWDYEFELENERVFFLCYTGNFSIMDYMGCSGNCICFCNIVDEVLVFDLMKNKIVSPSPSWFERIPSSTSIGGSLSEIYNWCLLKFEHGYVTTMELDDSDVL